MAAKNEAKVRFTAETKELTAQLNDANAALASLRAALRLNEAELKNNGDQTEYLKTKQQLLKTELEFNRAKQEALNEKLEAAKRLYGENNEETSRWATKLTAAQTEQQQLEAQLKQTEQAIQDQTDAEEKAQTPLEQLNRKIEEQQRELEELKTDYKNVALEQGSGSDAAQELKGKIDDLNSELNENKSKLQEVDSALDDAGDSAETSANGGWTTLKAVVADLASNAIQQGIDKLKEFASETMQLGIDFSSSMSNVQAISGATSDEMAQLEQTARDLGSTTKFSATDVSDAFGYMAMAGWDATDMLGGIEGVLNLAAASGEDLATTSDIVTDALTAFGYEAGDAGHFADVLAAASASANTNVEMMGESFKYAAPVAGSLGYSAEDTSLALGLMANAGIKASQGGTALRTILTNMVDPSDEMTSAMDRLGVSLDDGNGNMLSFRDVMTQLRDGFDGMKTPEEDMMNALAQLDKELADGTISQDEYNTSLDSWIESTYGAEDALKAQAAAQLAGKTGMSGLLAIVNASDEDFNKLADAVDHSSDTFVTTADGSVMTLDNALKSGQETIESYEGAASSMAATMQDNLGGDLTSLGSAMDEFKLKLFDSIETPARNIVQFITTSVIPAATQVLQFIQQHSTAFGILAGVIGVITAAMVAQNAVQAIKTAMDAAEAASLGALISAKMASAAASLVALGPYILIVAAIALVIVAIIAAIRHWDWIKEKMLEVANSVKTTIQSTWQSLKTVISIVMNAIRSVISTVWNGIRNTVSTVVNTIRNTVSSVFNAIRSIASSVWNAIKTAITNPVQSAKSTVTNIFNTIKSTISGVVNGIKSTVSSTFNAIKDAMTKPIESAKSTIQGIMNRIKGIFPLHIGRIFSGLQLPHISVSGGSAPFGIGGKGSLPHFSVSWHAKGVVFDAPTLIPTLDGYHGVGEAGPEAVSPVSVLQSYIGDAVQRYVPHIDYDLLGEKVAAAVAGMDITMEVDNRTLGRVVRGLV